MTREFAPGYRVSACAHLLHLMPHALIKELVACSARLAARKGRYGDDRACSQGRHGGGARRRRQRRHRRCIRCGRRGLSRDTSRVCAQLARALEPVMDGVPPRLGTEAWSDRLALLRLAWGVRRLGRRDMRELLRIVGMNVYDLLEEHFDTPLLKGALGFDAVLGTNFGPRSPGTVLTLLYRLAAHEHSGFLAQPSGGMGALVRCAGQVSDRRRGCHPHERAGRAHHRAGRIARRAWCLSPPSRLPRMWSSRAAIRRRRSSGCSAAHSSMRGLCGALRTCARGALPPNCISRSMSDRHSPEWPREALVGAPAHRAVARGDRARLQPCQIRRVLERADVRDHRSERKRCAACTRGQARPFCHHSVRALHACGRLGTAAAAVYRSCACHAGALRAGTARIRTATRSC